MQGKSKRLFKICRAGALVLARAAWAAAAATALLVACGTRVPPPPAGAPLSALPPMAHPAHNPGTPQKVALGAQLFVDPRLSGSGKMSCQGCHYRHQGWTDGQVLSLKDDGKPNARHTPSLYNVGYQTAWYWDGRAATLEGQVLAAWRAQTGADPVKVALALGGIPGYAKQFQAVFGSAPTPDTVAQALAAYLRTKNSDDSPWDRYERGDRRAVTADAVAGQQLFMGKAGCATCHAPPFYGNSSFFNIGLEGGPSNTGRSPDPGRYNVTKNEADRGAFKTPSLRSVALGAPYFHDGSVATLDQAVQLMASGGGNGPNKSPLLTPRNLSERERAQVVAFLQSLTSTEPWTAPVLP